MNIKGKMFHSTPCFSDKQFIAHESPFYYTEVFLQYLRKIVFLQKLIEKFGKSRWILYCQFFFCLVLFGMMEFVYDFSEPFTSCILFVFFLNHSGQCLHFMVQVHLFVFCHQSYTVFIALPVSTPMVRADNKFACCLDVFLSITQTKIDSSLSIYIVLFGSLPYKCSHFHNLQFNFWIEHCKVSKLFPNCSQLSRNNFNLIKFNSIQCCL